MSSNETNTPRNLDCKPNFRYDLSGRVALAGRSAFVNTLREARIGGFTVVDCRACDYTEAFFFEREGYNRDIVLRELTKLGARIWVSPSGTCRRVINTSNYS